MGWGEETVTMSNVQDIANGLIEYMNSSNYNTFYIEVLGTTNNKTTIRFYRGSF